MHILEIIPESVQFIKISDKEYFSDKYKDYVSNSKLSLIDPERDGSIEKYINGFDQSYNESFELGSAIHGKLLLPEEYSISHITKPSAKLGLVAESFYDSVVNKGMDEIEALNKAFVDADYYKGNPSDNRRLGALSASRAFVRKRKDLVVEEGKELIILSDKLLDTYKNMISAITKDGRVLKMLKPEGIVQDPEVYSEYAIFCDIVDTKTGVITKFKAKLDNFTVDLENNIVTLNDLKTTRNIKSFFEGYEFYKEDGTHVVVSPSFVNYNYYRQCGVYLWLLQHVMRDLHPNIKFTYNCNILAVQSIPDYESKIFKVSKKWIDKGLEEFKKLILLVNDGQNN